MVRTARPRRQRGAAAQQAGIFLLLLLGALVSIFPFYWMVAGSLKPSSEIFVWPPTFIPLTPSFAAYQYVWETMEVPRVIFNSALIAVLEVGLNIVFSTMAAYALVKLRFPGRNILFIIVLALMVVPFQIMMIPLFLQIDQLGLLNTYAAVILPGAVSSFSIFLMRQALLTVPNDYIEAARIDGANHFIILARIAVPMVMPLILTTILVNFYWSWNSFLWPYLVLLSDELQTLPIGLARYRAFEQNRWEAILAGAVITALPIVLLYSIIQRRFIESLVATGIKG